MSKLYIVCHRGIIILLLLLMETGAFQVPGAGLADSSQVAVVSTSVKIKIFIIIIFLLGILWQLYNYTQEQSWLTLAEVWTNPIAPQQYNNGTHDVGFMLFYSFGLGYQLTNRSDYHQIVLRAAQSLSERFNPLVRCTQSWGAGGPWNYHFPVITGKLDEIYWKSVFVHHSLIR